MAIQPLGAMQSLSMEERQKIAPAYTVTPLTRKTVKTIAIKDELGFRTVQKEELIEGYMVKTMRGDSIFINHDELVRMKLDRNLVPLVVNGGDDNPVAMQENHPALSQDQRQALDVLTKLVQMNPSLVAQLLNAQVGGDPKPDEGPEESPDSGEDEEADDEADSEQKDK